MIGHMAMVIDQLLFVLHTLTHLIIISYEAGTIAVILLLPFVQSE